MAITSRMTLSGDVGGAQIDSTITRSAASQITHNLTLAAAKAGVVSATPGTLTMNAGHGLVENDLVDVYWATGRRYNCLVGVVVGDAVPLTGGAGDALPAEATAVTVQKQTILDTDFVGELIVACAALSAKRARLQFYDGGNLRLGMDLVGGEAWFWTDGGTAINPLAAYTITHVTVTHADAGASSVFRLGVLYAGESPASLPG